MHEEELAALAAANSFLRQALSHPFGRRTDMRVSLALACVGVGLTALTAGTSPSHAQYAAQLYPYCALNVANGATTCYFRTREECGRSCIGNPWYLGAERAWASMRGGRPLAPRYVQP
jgi:hypothetical protein